VITMKVEGLDDTLRTIAALGEVGRREALEPALMAVATPMAEEISARVPKKTGRTAADVHAKISREARSNEEAAVLIGARPAARGGRDWLLGLLEFGTRRMRARPSVRPVYDAHRATLSRDFCAALRPIYEDVIRKLAKRGRRAMRARA